ncbi:MAG: glycosyltransferase [Patescibacteria group bacterium]|jgi:glycosyltransferase involved in cell wall biosynthesis
MLIDFCLPAKDEELVLEANVKRLVNFLELQKANYFWNIVIIINTSGDTSYSVAKELAENDERIKARNLKLGGKGRALKEYFQESSADILVFMDVDLATSLNNIPALIDPILNQEADLVIGSRLLPNSRTNRSFSRNFISEIYNFLSRLILRHKFRDLQCGFKALRKELFNHLQPYFIDNKWFFDTELIILAARFGYEIKEIPVDWQENRYSRRLSKIHIFRDSWSFVKNLFYFKHRLNNLKICVKK